MRSNEQLKLMALASEAAGSLRSPAALCIDALRVSCLPAVLAHFGGAGSYGAQYDSVMSVFAEAAERGDPRMRNVYFDMAVVVTPETSDETAALIARRIRQLGARRILYGSDLSPPGGSIQAGWRILANRLPLTDDERRTIAGNVLRFMQ